MSKIYLPDEVTSTNCAYMYDKDTIRVYESVPRVNATINYTDYFINSDYYTRSGSTSFGSYSTINYNCITYTDFTTNYVYSLSFPRIMIMALIICGVPWFLLRTLLRRYLYGRKKY